jgi:hypothetical protein
MDSALRHAGAVALARASAVRQPGRRLGKRLFDVVANFAFMGLLPGTKSAALYNGSVQWFPPLAADGLDACVLVRAPTFCVYMFFCWRSCVRGAERGVLRPTFFYVLFSFGRFADGRDFSQFSCWRSLLTRRCTTRDAIKQQTARRSSLHFFAAIHSHVYLLLTPACAVVNDALLQTEQRRYSSCAAGWAFSVMAVCSRTCPVVLLLRCLARPTKVGLQPLYTSHALCHHWLVLVRVCGTFCSSPTSCLPLADCGRFLAFGAFAFRTLFFPTLWT